VVLAVTVPADAKVFVNGHETTSTGTDRTFVSRGLVIGGRYTYEVRVELVVSGKTVSETKSVQMTAGEVAQLAFSLNGDGELQANNPTVTKLTLHVPADARVILSGHASTSTGTVREFSTTTLAPGSEWSNYTVRVELERNGQLVTREQTISLAAGDTRELTFDFSDSVADATGATAATR
jgi:uncharacterized protein (TIGR03000 family)